MAYASLLKSIKDLIDRMNTPAGKIARFSYTEDAYANREIEGVSTYDFAQAQNIPDLDHTDTNPIILDKGIRAQGASIARNFQNHFTGRVSFNLNLVVDLLAVLFDWFVSFLPSTPHIYDTQATYMPGDRAMLTMSTPLVPVYATYERNSNGAAGTVNIPPTNTQYWQRMDEITPLARELADSAYTDLNNVVRTGVYSFITTGAASAIQHFPPIPPGTTNASGVLTVKADINGSDVTEQSFLFIEPGIEFTRTLRGTAVVWDWYKTKAPYGLEIVGVPNAWAFRIGTDPNDTTGRNLYGHLYMFYEQSNPTPAFEVDFANEALFAQIAIHNSLTTDVTLTTGLRDVVMGLGYSFSIDAPLVVPAGGSVQIDCRCGQSVLTDPYLPSPGADISNLIMPPLAQVNPAQPNLSATFSQSLVVPNPTYGHLLWRY